MTRDHAVHIVLRGIGFRDCNAAEFFEALKVLSKDELEKVYLEMERQSLNDSHFSQEVKKFLGGISCFTR